MKKPSPINLWFIHPLAAVNKFAPATSTTTDETWDSSIKVGGISYPDFELPESPFLVPGWSSTAYFGRRISLVLIQPRKLINCKSMLRGISFIWIVETWLD